MASLNTFGAIITHAIALETSLRDYYQAIGDEQRAQASDARRMKLEKVRREHVLEITLESIDGLDADNYRLNLDDTSDDGQRQTSETAARFYNDVSPKINVRQAQRALERCAKQHAEWLDE